MLHVSVTSFEIVVETKETIRNFPHNVYFGLYHRQLREIVLQNRIEKAKQQYVLKISTLNSSLASSYGLN